MRSLLAAAAAIATLAATPALAETAHSGYANASFTYVDTEAAGFSDESEVYAVGGAVAFPLTDSLGMQLDAEYAYADVEPDAVDQFGGTAHLFARNAEGLIGGFLGAISVDGDTVWGGGVEADAYRGDWTFGGRLAYLTSDDVDADLYALEGHAMYFYGDNFSIDGTAGIGQLESDVSGGEDSTVYALELAAEYRFASFPGSVFGGVSYADADDFDVQATAIQVGFRYGFQEDSLKARDRTGASLRGIGTVLAGLVGLGGSSASSYEPPSFETGTNF